MIIHPAKAITAVLTFFEIIVSIVESPLGSLVNLIGRFNTTRLEESAHAPVASVACNTPVREVD
jgi:hypothetical protein